MRTINILKPSFNPRLREEATDGHRKRGRRWRVSIHASVKRRQIEEYKRLFDELFQSTPP